MWVLRNCDQDPDVTGRVSVDISFKEALEWEDRVSNISI